MTPEQIAEQERVAAMLRREALFGMVVSLIAIVVAVVYLMYGSI